jgi:hypothetical protein
MMSDTTVLLEATASATAFTGLGKEVKKLVFYRNMACYPAVTY